MKMAKKCLNFDTELMEVYVLHGITIIISNIIQQATLSKTTSIIMELVQKKQLPRTAFKPQNAS